LTYFDAFGLVGFLFGGAGGSVWVGRRFCHSGLTLTLFVFSSYFMMSCVVRNWKNWVSLFFSSLDWSANSSILCHCPSFMMVKSFSIVKACLCSI